MSGDRPATADAFLRFLIVGGAFAVIYSVTTAGIVSHSAASPGWVSALVWLACIPPAYWCQRRFTFRPRADRRGALWLYALTQALSLGIVTVIAATFSTREMGWNTMVYLAASALAAVTSFALNRYVVFSR
jgi:putative flippase GtrA